jgi:hypothetical protein
MQIFVATSGELRGLGGVERKLEMLEDLELGDRWKPMFLKELRSGFTVCPNKKGTETGRSLVVGADHCCFTVCPNKKGTET